MKKMDSNSIQSLKEELEELGISRKFIESKDITNIYMAKKIAESYDFGRELTSKEKKSLIYAMLDNYYLNKNRHRYIATLIKSFEQIGLNEQEIYGTIINLGVNGNVLEETGYAYPHLLCNRNNVRYEIGKHRVKIEKTVSPMTILTALSRSINEQEEQELKRELEVLGVSRQLIEEKRASNLYMAKAVVESYDFGRELTPKERGALIQAILDTSQLNKAGSNKRYLSRLMQRFEQIGLKEQEIYGAMINLGVNGKVLHEIGGFGYSKLLINENNLCQEIAKYRERMQTEVTEGTVKKAVKKVEKEAETGIDEQSEIRIEGLGISREFIESKDITNIYMAKKIVEGYDFGRELTSEEKRVLIQAILRSSLLNKTENAYLYRLMQRFERMGLNEQEIYGTIINLGVNGRVLEGAGVAYSDLLSNKDNAVQKIETHKNKIEKRVSSMTILTAMSRNLNEQEEEKLKAELENLGLDREFIEAKRVSNLYTAKAIVEEYNFGREITQQEKRGLIQMILNTPLLDKNYSIYVYLSALMQRFQQLGMEEQEIYGTIINLAVHGKVLEEPGYGYINLLENHEDACQRVVQYKDKIETRVSPITMLAALSYSIKGQEEQELGEELEALGINREFIDLKDGSNLYMAKAVVESYDFGRELTIEEKRSLIQAILNDKALNKGRRIYLSRLMRRLEQIGLDDKAIYGVIINLGVNGTIVKEKGYRYSNLLLNRNYACKTIVQYRDEMKTKVSETTIQRALKKAEETMRLTVKKEKMEEQPETRVVLDELVRQEIELENVVEQEQQE